MLKVLIAGGTGLVGSRLSDLLAQKNYKVIHLSRENNPKAKYPTFQWDINKDFIEERAFEGVEYVINLAGAGIVESLWTKSRKKLIIDSRVKSTDLLASHVQKLETKPKAFLSATAIGIYGDRGNEELTEDSEIGTKGFLVKCCKEWEYAITKASVKTDIRTIGVRIGIVLSTKGGALSKMMMPLKFFTASYFGNGQQWYSWIHIDDVCRMFIAGMEKETMKGIYNGVSPNPLTNKDLMRQLVKALDKRALLISAPKAVLRMGMGEMADAVLNSSKIFPARMEKEGFEFGFSEFQGAIRDVVEKKV